MGRCVRHVLRLQGRDRGELVPGLCGGRACGAEVYGGCPGWKSLPVCGCGGQDCLEGSSMCLPHSKGDSTEKRAHTDEMGEASETAGGAVRGQGPGHHDAGGLEDRGGLPVSKYCHINIMFSTSACYLTIKGNTMQTIK